MAVLSPVDLAVVVLYLVLVIYIGLRFTNKVKTSVDFFIGGRSLGTIVIMATVCATIVGGGAVIGRGGLTYTSGVSAILAAVPYMIGMYVFSTFAPRIREIGIRNNVASLPEFMNLRFGRTVAIATSALVVFTMVATVGTQITATATVFRTIGSPWGISYETGAWVATLFFVSYTVASGLFGVAYTDLLQFFVFVPILYVVIPMLVLARAGGYSGLVASTPREMWSLKPSATIIGYMVTNFFFTMAGAEMWQRAFASKSERSAFWGFFTGNTVYAVGTTVFTVIVAMGALALFPDLVQRYGTADAAIPAFSSLLPVVLGGLFIGSLLAVLMSTSDSYLMMAGQGFMNMLQELGLMKGTQDRTQIAISRAILVVFGLLALLFALYVREAYLALMYAWTFFAASLGPAAVAALFWRKATTPGILASILTGFAVSMLWGPLKLPYFPSLGGCVSSLAVLIVVCLLTYDSKNPAPYPEVTPFWDQLRAVLKRP